MTITGFEVGKPATNRLSYGATIWVHYTKIIRFWLSRDQTF
jgi:hypothetical protein